MTHPFIKHLGTNRNMKSRILQSLFIGMALLGMASCKPNRGNDNRPSVTASIAPLTFFIEEIGGNRLDINILAPSSADPETFEPTMAQMRRLSASQLLFTTGNLPFEEKISAGGKNKYSVVNLSDSLQLIMGTHGHDEADPHIWVSLHNAQIISRQVERALAKTYPEYASEFADNLAKLERRLQEEDAKISQLLAPYRGGSFLVWHPSLSYFARDYGLNQIALSQEHKEMSINQLKERIEKTRTDSALVFFFQKEYDNRQAQIVTDATGLQPVEIAPLSTDIIATINTAANAFSHHDQ